MVLSLSALFLVTSMVSIQVTFSKPYDVSVTDIGSDSSVVHWKTTEKMSLIERFKVHCSGTRLYMSRDGRRLSDTDEKIQYAPAGNNNVLVGDLQANFNYSCTLKEFVGQDDQVLHGEVSDPFHFTTAYGDPEEPLQPQIHEQPRNHSIKILLYSTSTRFGPISGYQVQFFLVESKTEDGRPIIDDEFFEPFSPFSQLLKRSEAQKSSEARSFWIGFGGKALPNNIVIDDSLLNEALKSGREYTVITVPYTLHQEQNASFVLFTPSKPSAIFKTYTLTAEQLNTNEPVELAIAIALGVLLPLIVLGYLGCFGLLVLCVLRRKKKKIKKKNPKRDESKLRESQLGDSELPWYHQQTSEDDQEGHPLLEPSSSTARTTSTLPSHTCHQQQLVSGATRHCSEPQVMCAEAELLTRTSTLTSSVRSEVRPANELQSHKILPPISDSIACEQQFLKVPSDSIEMWATPNTSPSNSLLIEHSQSTPDPEIKDDDQIAVKCVPVLSSLSNVHTSDCEDVYISSGSSSSSCVSDGRGEEDRMLKQTLSSTDLHNTYGLLFRTDESKDVESPSDCSNDLSEDNSVTERCCTDKEFGHDNRSTDDMEIISCMLLEKMPRHTTKSTDMEEEESALKEQLMEGIPERGITEQRKDSSVTEEPLTEQILLGCKYSSTDCDHIEEVSSIEEFLKDDMFEHDEHKDASITENPVEERKPVHTSKSFYLRENVSVTAESLSSCHGKLECALSSNEEVLIMEELSKGEALEPVDYHRSVELTEEDSVTEETFTRDQDICEYVKSSSIDLKKEASIAVIVKPSGHEIGNVDSNARCREENSEREPLMQEHIQSSTDLWGDVSIMEEPSKAENLKFMDRRADVRDKEEGSLTNDPSTCGMLEHCVHGNTDLVEEVSVKKKPETDEKLEYCDSSIDLREENSVIKKPLTGEKLTLDCAHGSSIDFSEEMSIGKPPPSPHEILQRADSSIDLREETSIVEQPSANELLKRADSNIDLRVEESETVIANIFSDVMRDSVHSSSADLRKKVVKPMTDQLLLSSANLREDISAVEDTLTGDMIEHTGRADMREHQGDVITKESTTSEVHEYGNGRIDVQEVFGVGEPLSDNNSCDLRKAFVMEDSLPTVAILERVRGRIDLREDAHVSKESLACEELESVDSSIDIGEVGEAYGLDTTLRQTNSDTTYCREDTSTKDEHTTVDYGALERVGNTIDLGEFVNETVLDTISDNDCITEDSVAIEPLEVGILELVHNISATDPKKTVKDSASETVSRPADGDTDSKEEVAKVKETTKCETLERVASSIDLREDLSVTEDLLPEAMLKPVNSSIDLREELSIDEYDKESHYEHTAFCSEEKQRQQGTLSLGLDVSTSCSVHSGANDELKDDILGKAQPDITVDVHKTVDQLLQTKDVNRDVQPIMTTNDDVRIIIELDEDRPPDFDVQLSPHCSMVTVTKKESPTLAPQPLSSKYTSAGKFESRTQQVTSSQHRSLSQFILEHKCATAHSHSTASLPIALWGDQGHDHPLSISKSVASEISHHSHDLSAPETSTGSEIYDAHSIQLSRVSNQSRSTSSGNYSHASQIFNHSVGGSRSDSSDHPTPQSSKDERNVIQQPTVRSSHDRSGQDGSTSHSLTSHVYKHSSSGSSDVIYTKTVEEQCPMAASLTVSDKHITPAHCSVRGSSDSGASVFKDVMGMSTEGFPEAHPVLEVFNVSARHDPHTVQSTVGPEAKVSQESVRLFHSKPTLNLMDERSSRASPSKDSVLQASDSVTFQSKLPDTIVEVKCDSLDHLGQQSLSIIPHSNPLNWESPGHIAVMIDSNEPLNDANNRASTLSDAKTTSSLSRTSHSSTDYYTAHESLDFSSESSVGGGALDSASDHRDSLQPTTEPVDAKGNNLLKTSSSASLFIPRGFSNVRQENTLRGSRHQRGSTSTLYSILAQLSEASGDDDHEAGDPQTAHRVYEPY